MSNRILANRYELTGKIGEGGMAVVFRATDLVLNRQVAIKVLRPEYTNDAVFVESFKRESQMAAGLCHPNIVNIYDVGKEGNIYYIVMELIEGRPLSEYIKQQGALDPKRAVRITTQVAAGLALAHKNHLIHRDVKPQNIVITNTGSAKITDFGIAKQITDKTLVGEKKENVMGSVHYFSPEQARGAYVDERSDIYSLGICLFEMLTGKVPFDGETAVEVAMKHVSEDMVRPTSINPDVPQDLEDIILKATDKLPINRYRSMDDFIMALNLVRYSRTVSAAKEVPFEPLPLKDDKEEETVEHVKHGIWAKFKNNIGIVEEEVEEDEPEEDEEPEIEEPEVTDAEYEIEEVLEEPTEVVEPVKEEEEETPKEAKQTPEEEPEAEAAEETETFEEEKEVGKSKKKKGKIGIGRYIAIIIAIALAVIASKPVANFIYDIKENGIEDLDIDLGDKKATEVTVPNLDGLTKTEAEAELEKVGLTLEINLSIPSSTYGVDEIMSQNPVAGTKVKTGQKVTVNISTGRTVQTVPNLIGKTYTNAKQLVKQSGYQLGEITTEYSATVSKNLVIRQTPDVYTQLEKGGTVSFVYSLGPEPEEEEVVEEPEHVTGDEDEEFTAVIVSGYADIVVDLSEQIEQVLSIFITLKDANGTRTVINETRTKDEGSITYNIGGTGTDAIAVIYINNELYQEYTINFNEGIARFRN